MSSNKDVANTIRKYLVGHLDDAAREEVEQRLLTDEGLYEELLAVEDELIDSYVRRDLNDAEMKALSQNLAAPERQQKLRFARALKRYAAEHPVESLAQVPAHTRISRQWPQFFSRPFVLAGTFALLLIAVFGVWRQFVYQSDVDKGLIALNSAYRAQRPVEARLTRQNYSPFITTRGNTEQVDALELRRAELLLSDAVRDKPSAASHHALGKLFLSKKELDPAIEQFQSALKLDPNNAQIHADLGAAWLEKGKASLERPDAGKGMEELTRSLASLNKALELNNSLLEPLFNRALAAERVMMFDQAERDWNEYLKRDSTSLWAVEAQKNLKLLEERKARTSGSAEKLFSDFVQAANEPNDDVAWSALSLSRERSGNSVVEKLIDGLVKAENDNQATEAASQGTLLSYAGKLEADRVGDRMTLDLARIYTDANPDQRKTLIDARALMQAGMGLYLKGEWQPAIEQFTAARSLFERANDKTEALKAEAWRGYSYLRIPDPETAVPIFEQLSKVFEAHQFRSAHAQSLLALADGMNARGEFSKALEFAGRSLALSEELQDQQTVIRSLQATTIIQNIIGNYRDSLASSFRALKLADSIPPAPQLTWPFYHEASTTSYSLGMFTEAMQFENEALRLAQNGQLPFQASRSYDRLALILDRQHNYDAALTNIEQARQEGMKIKSEKTRTNVLAHTALNLADIKLAAGDYQGSLSGYDEALQLYERLKLDIYKYRTHQGKLMAYMGLNDQVAAEAELKTMLWWFEQNRERIEEESYRNKFFDTGQQAYDLAVDFMYSRKRDTAGALDYAESSRARSLLELLASSPRVFELNDRPELKLESKTSPLKLDQIKNDLPKGTQLLEYAVLDDKVVMWLVSRDGLKKSFAQNIPRAELDKTIRNFVKEIATRQNTQAANVRELAKQLYSKLLGPIESELDRNAVLCIVPDGNLSFLPFAALVSPSSGRFLIEDFAIQTAPSATVFIQASQRAAERVGDKNEQLLAVGNPHFDRDQFKNLPDLPDAAREAEKIAELYKVNPLIGDRATVDQIKIGLPLADVAHFATHAVADDSSPLLSKLLLSHPTSLDRRTHHADSGVLVAADVYAMKLPRTRLVVLSACQTGIEHAYRGEGAVGLARPFIAAGVPLVVASLWPVESQATADLMISFHKHRKQEHVPSIEALRRAQLELLHNQQPGSTNYGWAAFVAIGGYASF